MTNKCMKTYTVYLTYHEEVQIKATVRYHYAPIRIAKHWSTENIRMLVRLRDNENTYTLLVGMQNGTATLQDIVEVSLKN